VGDVVELNFHCDGPRTTTPKILGGAAIYLVCSWSVAFQQTRE